ncbi:MAG: amino acid ABC transporter ATP-binding protein [Clostridia bacterium]|nr:amino acid ABC transporter ATP-binding protein [Clostridia bacterium]
MSLLKVEGLSKSFGTLKVLQNVDLSVESGERIVIIGGSGCGKSVFLRSLVLLEKPDAGHIWIDGDEITAKGADINQIRRHAGMVFQKFCLFSEMDVMDNLCLAPVHLKGMTRKDAEKKAMDLLWQVGLSDRAHADPRHLSGGQQQRIAICRCLMMEPRLLLFDEPTSALDPTMVGEVLAVIRMLAKRDMTMLIVTHEMHFAQEVATRVLFFADHGIYEQGTPDEIFMHPRREKTVDFIRKMKYFEFAIAHYPFDFMAMQGGIQTFGEKYGMDIREIQHMQITCEELVMEMIGKCNMPSEHVDMRLSISYAESDHTATLDLTCGGTAYNPFEADDENLGVMLVKKMVKHWDYRLENSRNHIHVLL